MKRLIPVLIAIGIISVAIPSFAQCDGPICIGDGWYENITVWFNDYRYISFGNAKLSYGRDSNGQVEFVRIIKPDYKAILPWEMILYIEFSEWPSIM